MKSWLAIACLLSIAVPVAGQGAGSGSPQVEFRVTRFDPQDRESPTFEVGDAAKRVDVEVPLTFIAGPFKAPLRDGGFLDFWRGDSEKPEISLTITEAERKDLLLFFIPVKESFKVMKVRTPLTSIRGGDRYMVNATHSQIALKAGAARQMLIEPGKAGLVRAPSGNAASMPVLISIREGEEWTLASTETWYCDRRFRKYLFAYMSPRTRQLSFHAVSERL
jgi:hypothetical protein